MLRENRMSNSKSERKFHGKCSNLHARVSTVFISKHWDFCIQAIHSLSQSVCWFLIRFYRKEAKRFFRYHFCFNVVFPFIYVLCSMFLLFLLSITQVILSSMKTSINASMLHWFLLCLHITKREKSHSTNQMSETKQMIFVKKVSFSLYFIHSLHYFLFASK